MRAMMGGYFKVKDTSKDLGFAKHYVSVSSMATRAARSTGRSTRWIATTSS